MIDTFMVLWNRDRRRKGVKLLLTFLLICITASLLLTALYFPFLISLPKRENFARDFIIKTTATVQADRVDLTHKVSTERARVIEATPISITPCVTSVPATITHTPEKKDVKRDAAKKTLKKARQQRGPKPSSHQPSQETPPLKVMPPPRSTLRTTRSSTGPMLKPTVTRDTVVLVVTPVSTPTAVPSSVTNATATTSAVMGGTVVVSATPTGMATVESDTARAQQAPDNVGVSHLQQSGGPIFDDPSSVATDNPSYAAIDTNNVPQSAQGFLLSCLKKRPPVS